MALYALAINPWFTPDQHDDVLYFFGAISIWEHGTFALNGTPITDWPPVFSSILAPLLGLAGESVIVAKVAVLAAVGAGLWMVAAYSKLRGEEFPRILALIVGLLPISLICGAGVLSEWPFIFLSFAFLFALEQLRLKRSWKWCVIAGALLGTAALTRFAGVFLGAAIIAQGIFVFRNQRKISSAFPEITVALMGAIPWLLWKFRCTALIRAGEAPSGAYDNTAHYLERFSNFDLSDFLGKVESVLFSFGKAARGIVGSPALAWVAVVICSGLILGGLIIRIRRHGVLPAEWYVLVMLALLIVDLKKPERYFLPIAPLLIGYVLTAIHSLSAWAGDQWKRRLPHTLIVAWCAWLLVLDGQLLFRGNLSGNRGGFSMLASGSEDEFYRGDSLEMLRAIRYADEHAQNGIAIGTAGFHGKYIYAFTGRNFIYLDGDSPESTSWFILRGDKMPAPKLVGENPSFAAEFGEYRVYSQSKELSDP